MYIKVKLRHKHMGRKAKEEVRRGVLNDKTRFDGDDVVHLLLPVVVSDGRRVRVGELKKGVVVLVCEEGKRDSQALFFRNREKARNSHSGQSR